MMVAPAGFEPAKFSRFEAERFIQLSYGAKIYCGALDGTRTRNLPNVAGALSS